MSENLGLAAHCSHPVWAGTKLSLNSLHSLHCWPRGCPVIGGTSEFWLPRTTPHGPVRSYYSWVLHSCVDQAPLEQALHKWFERKISGTSSYQLSRLLTHWKQVMPRQPGSIHILSEALLAGHLSLAYCNCPTAQALCSPRVRGVKSTVQLMSVRSCLGLFYSYNRVPETICIQFIYNRVPKVGESQESETNLR